MQSQLNKYVCAECFEDSAIKQFIEENATKPSCDYCGRESQYPIAASLGDVAELIMEGIDFEWSPYPEDEGMVWDREEDRWMFGITVQTHDLLEGGEIEGLEMLDWDLLCDLERIIPDSTRAKRGIVWGREEEILPVSWSVFCQQVMYHTRFLFLDSRTHDGDSVADFEEGTIPIQYILDEISKWFSPLELLHDIYPGKSFYRARVHEAKELYVLAKDLGTPPVEKSNSSGRMHPTGIPVFYAAFDEDTAIIETYEADNSSHQIATVATFTNSRTLKVLDLTALPNTPSLFDPKRHLRPGIQFLQGFVNDIQKPVAKDGREHVEYVPTQVFTEYVRHVLRGTGSTHIDGILYPSAQSLGKSCCVLFVRNEDCCDPSEDKDEPNKLKLILRDKKRFKRLNTVPVQWIAET